MRKNESDENDITFEIKLNPAGQEALGWISSDERDRQQETQEKQRQWDDYQRNKSQGRSDEYLRFQGYPIPQKPQPDRRPRSKRPRFTDLMIKT